MRIRMHGTYRFTNIQAGFRQSRHVRAALPGILRLTQASSCFLQAASATPSLKEIVRGSRPMARRHTSKPQFSIPDRKAAA